MSVHSASFPQQLAATRPQLWLGLMLLALHAALAWGISDWLSRAFLLTHFGLFLIWQPLLRGERRLKTMQAALVVLVGLALAAINTWWMMAVWLSLLFSLAGGSMPGMRQRRGRLVSLFAALYLLALLLIWVVPHLFDQQEIPAAVAAVVRYGLPLLPLAIAAIRVEDGRPSSHTVDLFYSLLLLLLVAALVLGSFAVKVISHGNYPMALAQTLFGIALLLLGLSWLWNPHAGFSGIGQLMSRYLMGMGLPFEQWMQKLADLAERETQPQAFLAAALESMLELPWVAGCAWRTPQEAGEFGSPSKFHAEFTFRELTLVVYTRWSLGPSLLVHLRLLAQLLGYFYDAKRREQKERHSAYTQAIHETGARLTHDVKNLLQSLKSLCAAAESGGESGALQALMQRQLPQITQRLQHTLDKLKAPQPEQPTATNAAAWWKSLQQRYDRERIEFSNEGETGGAVIPAELFDSVAENLLQNALNKRKTHPDVRVRAALCCAPAVKFSVCDSGAPMTAALAGQLFAAPLPSHTGLGIGLYQAAKQAEQLGYRLALAGNEAGRVCFELSQAEVQKI